MSIWQELRRRKVLRVAGAYVVVAWILMQVASLLEETLELPGWFDKFTFAALLLGFPIALLLSWAYDISPDRSRPSGAALTRSAFGTMLVILVLAGGAYTFYLIDESSAPPVATREAPSIGVLPFADLSPAGDQGWFADGVTEEILNVLARTDGLRVPSRAASFRFRGEDVDLRDVAAELNVTNLLTGTVRSQGDRLRISAQLIDATDLFPIWTETYEQNLSDVFAVQDEISVNIATALFGELGVDALPENRFKGTRNLEAYNYYLQGLEKASRYSWSEKFESIPDFRRAIELDPEFSDAWVNLASIERIRDLRNGEPPRINASLSRALRMDPDNASAVNVLAQTNFSFRRWPEAEQLYLRAIDIEPGNAAIRRTYGQFLVVTGRVSRGLDEHLLAWDIEPAKPDVLPDAYRSAVSQVVNAYAHLGKFAEARSFYESEYEKSGLRRMGDEAYFVSMLADGMENEAREFGNSYLAEYTLETNPGNSAVGRIQFFLDRLDGNPEATTGLVEATLQRIEFWGVVRWGDIDNLILADELDLARELLPDTRGYTWGAPNRFTLYINDEIDPRYLPYRPNLLLIADAFPEVIETYRDIGVDVESLAREKGYIE